MKINKYIRIILFLNILISMSLPTISQGLKGKIISNGKSAEFVNITVPAFKSIGTQADIDGVFYLKNIPEGKQIVQISGVGFKKTERTVQIHKDKISTVSFEIEPDQTAINEVVVTGTMKETMINLSSTPIEIYTPTFFKMQLLVERNFRLMRNL